MSLLNLKKRLKDEKQLGVQFSNQGIRFALVNLKNNDKTLIDVEFNEANDWPQQKSFLEKKIAEFALESTPTIVIIPQNDYQIFLIEQPLLSGNEKREAIRWRIAEYIDFPVEEAVVDYIEVPQKNKDSNTPLNYVIVTRKGIIDEYANNIKALGLNLTSVDICQSALREIAFQLDDADVGQALLHIEEDKSHIVLFKNKTLYMMRDFDLGYDHIKKNNEVQDLALEIQRSIDYCSSNLKNAGISRIVLTPMPERKTELLSNLSNILGLPVRMINYSEFIHETEKLSINQANSSAFAIGAAISTAL
jgi:MSHA biogenesis protein MshI